MAKNYNVNHLKKDRVYSVTDLQALLGVTANTISNWVKFGLRSVDGQRPRLYRGDVVKAFLTDRKSKVKGKLLMGEFRCFACKTAVAPAPRALDFAPKKNGAFFATSICTECNAIIHKLVSKGEKVVLEARANPNTTLDQRHEETPVVPGGIWICPFETGSANDRIIFEWQVYAGKFSEKTVTRHHAAIRFLRETLSDKPFAKLTVRDIAKVRQALRDSLVAAEPDRKSRSTVSHIASHIRDFLTWLIKQDGSRQLPRDLPDYLELSKGDYETAAKTSPRPYPTVDEMAELLENMPSRTIGQLRDRAMISFALLGALRVRTLTTLLIRHIDVDTHLIIQDANEVEAKNGKSLRIRWFDIPEVFADNAVEWMSLMEDAGFSEKDALFPELSAFTGRKKKPRRGGAPVPVMTSNHAANTAFKSACDGHHTQYSPHCVKDAIAFERDRRALTVKQRKAWSENMGHDSEQTTDLYYAKMTEAERIEVLEGIDDDAGGTPFVNLTDEDKIALMNEVIHKLTGASSAAKRS